MSDHAASHGSGGHGSTKAILAAMVANLGIAVAKFIGFLLTSSAAMLAESVHSVADTTNQVLLLVGGKKARKPADATHPYGYGREQYVWAGLVSLLLFALRDDEANEGLIRNVALGISLLVFAGTLVLWLGGPALLLLAGAALLLAARRKTAPAAPTPLSDDERQRLRTLLGEGDGVIPSASEGPLLNAERSLGLRPRDDK